MAEGSRTFHWADYMVFSLALLVSAGIGIYYRVTGQKQRTTREFLLGGQTLRPLPVALSLQASFMSAVSILGMPAEIYMQGSMYAWILGCYFIAFPITAHVFVPIIHKLNMTSAYQILEKRFNKWVRVGGSLTFSIMMLLYMAIVLYAPALALSQVTGLSLWISIAASGLVCTFYTAMGGLKAVVWTDTFQMITIYAGIVALLIFGAVEVGGLHRVIELSKAANRIQLIDWSIDPRVRHTFWTQIIGGAVMTLTLYAANQTMIQRYISIQKTKDAQLAVYLALGSCVLAYGLLALLGLVVFAFYAFCDPLTSGQVSKADQIVPLFVMTILGPYPGLAGLFVAATFSAALSTVSSGVNSLATVVLEDVVKLIYKGKTHMEMRDDVATFISKLLAVIFGLVTIALGFAASVLGTKVLQIALSIFGVVGGPLLGVFILALFCPWANSAGALAGLVGSLVLCFWMQLGAIFSLPRLPPLPLNTTACVLNDTLQYSINTSSNGFSHYTPAQVASVNVTVTAQPLSTRSQSGLIDLYSVSYMWYSVIGTATAIMVGLLVSALTGCNREQKTLWTEDVGGVDVCCLRSRQLYNITQDSDKSEALQLKDVDNQKNEYFHELPVSPPLGDPAKVALHNGHTPDVV